RADAGATRHGRGKCRLHARKTFRTKKTFHTRRRTLSPALSAGSRHSGYVRDSGTGGLGGACIPAAAPETMDSEIFLGGRLERPRNESGITAFNSSSIRHINNLE